MKKIASWSLAVVLCVLAAELSLQLVAWVLATDGRDALPGTQQDYRIVTVGDSNTFGLYLDADETWPAQFQARWNTFAAEHSDVNPVEVINLGVPGTNSSRLLKNYREMLETFQPDLVLMMIGFNDWWTPNETWQPAQQGLFKRLLDKSRLYRFYLLLKADQVQPAKVEVMERVDSLGELTTEEIIARVKKETAEKQAKPQDPEKGRLSTRVKYGEKEFLLGYDGAEGEPGGFRKLESNLKAMADISNTLGVELVLLNYAGNQKFYKAANEKLANHSQKLGLPLVDVQQYVAPVCPKALECPEHFFPDMHPRPKGYALVAEAVFDYFRSKIEKGN